MTTEEKAKAYDDALEKAKKYHEEYWQVDAKDITETLFPQLRESEDERIRKEIIDFLETIPASELKRIPRPISEWFAWLEKQKEQKPAEWSEIEYIRKKAIVEVIERRIKNIESCPFIEAEFGAEYKRDGQIRAYKDVLSIIESMQD